MEQRVPSYVSHWNYFIALERDLENLSRYVEFNLDNSGTYSTETVRLLLAAASEVDVVLKRLCAASAPDVRVKTMDDYRSILSCDLVPSLAATVVTMPRFGLELTPWAEWGDGQNPGWWRDHNNVKHQRDTYYSRATLSHVLNAVGALLIVVAHFYRLTDAALTPVPALYRPPRELAHIAHTLGGETVMYWEQEAG